MYIPILDTVDPQDPGQGCQDLLQEFLQGKKIALPQYNVVATHGAAHNQEFEIECLVPKLDIQVFGTGGSRRAGEQAAAKLRAGSGAEGAGEDPGSRSQSRPRASQLKLAGIATIQPDAPSRRRCGEACQPSMKTEMQQETKAEAKQTKLDLKSQTSRS